MLEAVTALYAIWSEGNRCFQSYQLARKGDLEIDFLMERTD